MNNVVLIVEDEFLEQEFLKSVIEEELLPDDILLSCESGLQAVQLAKEYQPNIIIMDMVIPEMGGLKAIEEIRKFLSDVCITVLSACNDFSYAQKAISLKVFEYLLKPVKPAVFKEVFRRMLEASPKENFSSAVPSVDENMQSQPKYSKPFIEDSVKYIREHFRERLTLDMVASKAFVNPKYFSHVFKKELGISFSEYVIDLKIQYACTLLETTNYPAYRISLECGFSDPSYFNRVFCSQMNMTPQNYRKHASSSKLSEEL